MDADCTTNRSSRRLRCLQARTLKLCRLCARANKPRSLLYTTGHPPPPSSGIFSRRDARGHLARQHQGADALGVDDAAVADELEGARQGQPLDSQNLVVVEPLRDRRQIVGRIEMDDLV